MPDREIARLLNRCGVKTGYGNSWSEPRVRGFRQHHKIDIFKPGELAERGQVTLEEAAKTIGVATMTVFRMIKLGNLAANQVCKGAPWVIMEADVAAICATRQTKAPQTSDPAQQSLLFNDVDIGVL